MTPRVQTGASSSRESESSAAASGATEPAAQPHPQLSANQQSGQSATRRNEENSPPKYGNTNAHATWEKTNEHVSVRGSTAFTPDDGGIAPSCYLLAAEEEVYSMVQKTWCIDYFSF